MSRNSELGEIGGQGTDGRHVNEKRAIVVLDAAVSERIADAFLELLEARIDFLRRFIRIDIDKLLQLLIPRRSKKRLKLASAKRLTAKGQQQHELMFETAEKRIDHGRGMVKARRATAHHVIPRGGIAWKMAAPSVFCSEVFFLRGTAARR